jgi:RNA polymerase sigma-70 factor (ECF subfamily)
MTEQELVTKLRNSDREAFRYVVEKYQKMVINCAFKFVRDEQSAQDLAQEVFIAVFEEIRSFKAQSQLSTWIYRITISKSLNYLKAQKRKKRFAVLKRFFGEDKIEDTIKAGSGDEPDGKLEQEHRISILMKAVEKLPENQRIAFTLSKYDDMQHEEIARILHISISAVESLVHRAKANLKKSLYKYYKNR